MKLLLAAFAIVVALWLLGRRQEPEPVRYHEPEDGVQPLDPWVWRWSEWEPIDFTVTSR